MQLLRVLKILLTVSCSIVAFAELKHVSQKSVPRFASVKSNQANTRFGPGLNYPIATIIVSKLEPVEILSESDHWREIKDFDNQISWIHVSLLSPKRYVIVKSVVPVLMFNGPFAYSAIIANISPKVRCEFLNFCSTAVCKVKCSGVKGWIDRSNLWGIYDTEFMENNKWQLYFKNIF